MDSEQANTYVWRGINKLGNNVRGEMQAASSILVKVKLEQENITNIKIKKKSNFLNFSKMGGITTSDIAIFTRQLATMLGAGVPMINALEIIKSFVDKRSFKNLLTKIQDSVAGGTPFSNVLMKYPMYFDGLYCHLVSSGERAGTIDRILERLAIYQESIESLRKKVKKAMVYPIAVILIAIIVTGILLVKVVPQFQSVFESFGSKLPAFTVMVIHLSEFIQAYWLTIILTAFLVFFILRKVIKKSQSLQDSIDIFLLTLPIIGNILKKSAMARFARTLSNNSSAGIPLIDSLDSVAGASGNALYRNAIVNIKENISTGQSLNFAMKNTGVFPIMVVQMVAIGEESGALDEMLDKIAVIYEEEVNTTVDGLTSLLEPLIMVVLGVLVGGLVIAMYLPIFQLGSVIS